MRRDLRVLEMNDGELLSVLSMIEPKRNFEKSSRHDMQEEIIGWLISNGLTIGHKFSLMVDDRRKDAWMMNLNQNFCNCCEKKIDADATTHRICVIDSDDVRDNNSTMNGVSYHTKGNNPTVHITVPKKNSKGSSSVEPLSPIDLANKVPKPKNGKKKKKEKKGCCGGCCSEWGKFCVDLLSNV
ncbi:hypothetical protein QR680_014555 [Steinernema hermaphroditum]|uniref:Uncharacterized protein n=1 Tax=Steinernema hermaphroditum TaxID=289476 RepID=A0AA39IBG4_9BILA|nr:hypothetical protein QR680_014555 [Steinernema hermaphroditum]